MKYSFLLEQVFSQAKELKNEYCYSNMTAELLLEALTNVMKQEEKDNSVERQEVMRSLDENFHGDLSSLATFLQEYNTDPRQSGEPMEIAEVSGKEGSSEATCEDLMDILMRDTKGRLAPLYEDWKIRHKKNNQVEIRPKNEVKPVLKQEEELPAVLPEDVRLSAAELTAKADALQSKLFETVKGQNQAVSFLVSGWLEGEMRELIGPDDERPRASVLFTGPRESGMSSLIYTFAKEVGEPLYVFSGSANDGGNAIATTLMGIVLKGSPHPTRNNPARRKCIFLIDHMGPGFTPYPLQMFFTQVLNGVVQNEGSVSFRDCMFIFTTNAGASSLYDNPDIPDASVLRAEEITEALKKETYTDQEGKKHPVFVPAFMDVCAQGKVAVFDRVSAPVLRDIAQSSLERQKEQLKKHMGIACETDPRLPAAILYHLGNKAGADTVRFSASDFFTREITELFRINQSQVDQIRKVSFTIDLPEKEEAHRLFVQDQKQEALFFMKKKDLTSMRSSATVHINKADTEEKAEKIFQKTDIRFIILDFTIGCREKRYSNIEDIDSEGRDFFFWLRKEHSDVPVYLIETEDHVFSEEEKLSFLRRGARGFIALKDKDHPFSEKLSEISKDLYLEDSLLNLEKMKGRLSWGTRQSVDEKGNAIIELFELNVRKGNLFQAGQAAVSDVEMPDVKFDDIIGAKDAKEELRFFIRYLRNPRSFMGSGLEAPKGVLLYGPPGTGKTMLAKAMASEAGIAFIACDGSEFLKKYVGEGPELVHQYFQQARKFAPAVLFIDEIDAIGLNRASDDAKYSRDILTSFFTEMDGFHTSPDKPVFVMAATNASIEPGAPGSIDPALLRRFDRRILVDLPDLNGRIEYLQKQMKEYPTIRLNDKEVHTIAENTSGLSLALISQILNLAKRLALRQSRKTIDEKLITEAMEQYTSGDRRTRSEKENLRTARHEAGHAFLQWKAGKHPAYISIESRSDHHGYVRSSEEDFEKMNSKKEILDYIRWCLGGRAAELVYYGKDDGLTMGPSQDLKQATDAAVRLYCSFGMDEEFGLAVVDPNRLSETKHQELLDRVNDLLRSELEQGEEEIRKNRKIMDAFVDVLMVREHLNGDEIDEIFRKETEKAHKKKKGKKADLKA